MNFALLAKELRALRPMLWCLIGLYVCSLAYLLATELPDAQPFTPAHWLEKSREGAFGALALFSLMIGAGLLIHESDQGTLRFLDGLPLSRTRIFAAKTMAGLLILAWVPGLGLLFDVIFGQISRSSLDGPLPWQYGWVVAGLQMVAGAYLLALALVVSFVRSWFALVAGLIFWAYLWLRQAGARWLAYLDPYALLAPDVTGGQAALPWPQIGAHLGATGLLLIVAWLGFRQLGDGAQHAADNLGRSRLLRGLGTGLKFLGPFVWLGAVIHLSKALVENEPAASTAPVGEEAFARHETKRYEFLLRTAQWEDARALFGAADELHDRVAAFLGVPPPPARIVVDLASPVVPHAAGQTNWTKIRQPLAPGDDFESQRQILAHETAHVFIEQLGGGRLQTNFASIRCLHEGLATHVEQALFATEEERAGQRRAVAGAWSRGKVPFALLADNDTLSRQRDPNLAYALGAELARALIETHGREAPARLIRAFSRPGVRPGKEGAALWRDAMQAAALDFEQVTAAYESACAEIAAAEQEFTAGLPRLSAEVVVEGGAILVRPKFAGAAPGEIVCLIEDDEPFSFGARSLPAREDGAFVLDRARHLPSTLRYLLGWRTWATELPVFEPWAEATLP